MSTREALIKEIEKQPEPVLRDLQSYLASLLAHERNKANRPSAATTWPADYFSKTAGAFADEPLERPSQSPAEKREEW